MKKIVFILALVSSYTFAFDKMSVGYGIGSYNTNVYNIALQKDFDYKLFENTNLSLEVSSEYVENSKDDMLIISAQPMINYYITEDFYVELGIGAAYFNQKDLGGILFGSNFQFKESIGFGYSFSEKLDLTLKYTHYSNADLADANSGFDMGMLKLVYSF